MRVIHVIRKPLEGTVAQNVLKWGTGGINVDRSRVSVTAEDAQAMERCNSINSGRLKAFKSHIGTFNRKAEKPLDTTQGRWPANLILEHHPDCRQVGTKKVKTQWGQEDKAIGYADKDGKEMIANWVCVEDCPVRMLDEQSQAMGMHVAGNTKPEMNRSLKGDWVYGGGWVPPSANPDWYRDSGGASRFFKQVKP